MCEMTGFCVTANVFISLIMYIDQLCAVTVLFY